MSHTIWLSAGETSGDIHGACLLKALLKKAPELTFQGMGGQFMRAAGLRAEFRVEDLSVMGLTEVVGHLPKVYSMLRAIKKRLAEVRPMAVVVIDAPDFHFWVIRAAASLGIPVYYYISPKVWAWRQDRAKFIQKHVRRVLSILPFEVDFYKEFGMTVDYVGNPLVDMVNYPALAGISLEKGLIGLFPGSRKREITSLLPEFCGAARLLLEKMPELRFAIVKAPGVAEELLRECWVNDIPVLIEEPDNRWEFMRRCEMIIAASGTVALETALAGTPTIVTYKVSSLSYAVGKRLVKTPYVSLPNLILGEEVFPELLQSDCDALPLAKKAEEWLASENSERLDAIRKKLDVLREKMGDEGAADRAAALILSDFGL